MAVLKAFKGLRPPAGLANKVASRPYDVLNSDEARKEATSAKALIQADLYYTDVKKLFSGFKEKKALYSVLYLSPVPLVSPDGRFSVIVKCDPAVNAVNINWLALYDDVNMTTQYNELQTMINDEIYSTEAGIEDKDMLKTGVEFNTKLGDGDTGTCIVLVTPDAERTMLTCLGVCAQITEDDIPIDDIKSAKLIYLEGYLWDSLAAKKSCMRAIREAKKLGKKIAFTVSDPFVVSRYKNEFLELLKNIDLLFCNLEEGQMLTDLSNQKEIVKQWLFVAICR